MAEMHRNLQSSILLDESYLSFMEVLKTSSDKIRRNADEASGFLLDEPSQNTISMIIQLCEKLDRLAQESQESVEKHHKEALEIFREYNTLL